MTWLIDRYKSNGQFEAAGRIAKATNAGRSYGCHFGMKSTLEHDREVFFKAYDAYVVPTSFDVYWAQGLYKALEGCSIEQVKQMVGFDDNDIVTVIAAEGYANDYIDVQPICIMPHGVELHAEGKAHIEANGPK